MKQCEQYAHLGLPMGPMVSSCSLWEYMQREREVVLEVSLLQGSLEMGPR
jgi:hypothetical protein